EVVRLLARAALGLLRQARSPHGQAKVAPARSGRARPLRKDAYDIEYEVPMGFKELEGVHNRTNYDLTRHQQFSGKDLQYIDQENGNERYIPFIIETSAGLTRQLLMVLCDAYEEQKVADKGNEDDWRTVLHFHPTLA